jgi:hypothetical protein
MPCFAFVSKAVHGKIHAAQYSERFAALSNIIHLDLGGWVSRSAAIRLPNMESTLARKTWMIFISHHLVASPIEIPKGVGARNRLGVHRRIFSLDHQRPQAELQPAAAGLRGGRRLGAHRVMSTFGNAL